MNLAEDISSRNDVFLLDLKNKEEIKGKKDEWINECVLFLCSVISNANVKENIRKEASSLKSKLEKIDNGH